MTTVDDQTALTFLDFGFDEESEAVKPTLQPNPQAIWMTGNLSTTTLETAVGLHVPAEVNPALDKRLADLGIKRYIVNHKSGDVRQKPYWNLSCDNRACSLIPVAYGLKSCWEMSKKLDDRIGIAYGVGTVKNQDGSVQLNKKGQPKQKVQLHLRFFLHELLDLTNPENGFNEWLQLGVSNYLVDYLWAALNAQFRVLGAYDALMRAQGKKDHGQFWGFSIPLLIGEPKDVGPNPNDQTTIYPMVAKIPDLPVNAPATIQYLREHRIPGHIQQILKGGEGRQSLLEETVIWSYERSVEIVEGKQDQQETVVTEEPVEASAVELPPLPAVADPLVDADQMAWVRDTYCGNAPATIAAVLAHYQVSDLAQLRRSQYQAMYDQINKK